MKIYELLTSLWSTEDIGLIPDNVSKNHLFGIIILILAILMGVFSLLANKRNWFSFGTFAMAILLLLISSKWTIDLFKFSDMKFGLGMILYLIGTLLGYVSSILGFAKK